MNWKTEEMKEEEVADDDDTIEEGILFSLC